MSLVTSPPVAAPTAARPHRVRWSILLRAVLAVVLTLSGSVTVMVAAAGTANAASGRLTDFDNRMLVLVNKARSDAGVGTLKAASGLTNLSVMWSSQMADGATNNQLQHNPNAFQQTLSYGASNRTAWAENVAKWSPASTSADEIFNAYMASPGHRANILGSRYAYIGIGSVTGSNGASWNTMTFTDKVESGQEVTATGNLEYVGVEGSQIVVRGWAYDPNAAASSIDVHVYVNGGAAVVRADKTRGDVNSALGISGKHGFEAGLGAAAGNNAVCVYAIGIAGSANSLLGCSNVTYTPPQPAKGNLEELWAVTNGVHVKGWAYDPKSANQSSPVRVEIDGSAVQIPTPVSRGDVNSYFGVSGTHGFDTNIPAAVGRHTVCVTALPVSTGASTLLGCRSVEVFGASPPTGQLDTVQRSSGTVRITGWALDPNATSTSVQVLVYVNGQGLALDRATARPDVNAYFGVTGNHGYDVTVGAPSSGPVQVCAYAISGTGGGNTTLGCRNA